MDDRAKLTDAELLDSLTDHEHRIFDLGYRNGYDHARNHAPARMMVDQHRPFYENQAIPEGPGS